MTKKLFIYMLFAISSCCAVVHQPVQIDFINDTNAQHELYLGDGTGFQIGTIIATADSVMEQKVHIRGRAFTLIAGVWASRIEDSYQFNTSLCPRIIFRLTPQALVLELPSVTTQQTST